MRRFEKVSYSNKGVIPTRADAGSAGYDFYSTTTKTINPGECAKFITDIKVDMEKDEVLLLFVRSSIGMKRNLMLANSVGVIDSTYYNNSDNEGNIMYSLFNYGDKPQLIEVGDRVMQGVFVKYYTTENDQILSNERTGGIGSSGK